MIEMTITRTAYLNCVKYSAGDHVHVDTIKAEELMQRGLAKPKDPADLAVLIDNRSRQPHGVVGRFTMTREARHLLPRR